MRAFLGLARAAPAWFALALTVSILIAGTIVAGHYGIRATEIVQILLATASLATALGLANRRRNRRRRDEEDRR